MIKLLLWSGRFAGIAGVVVTAIAFAARAGGFYWLGGVQAITLFTGGTALMVLGCLGYVAAIAEAGRPTG